MQRFFAALIAAIFSTAAFAGQARVAVAANFTAPMKAIATAFGQETGHTAIPSFGSSGKLFAQVVNGAPFDAFLSADAEKPAALIERGLAQEDTLFTYAIGTLTLWAPGAADARELLLSGNYDKLALANPRLAPYGEAALQVLDGMQLREQAQPHLVTGENIAQTYQFVATGNAQLGFVALSQVIEDGAAPGGAWVVPAQLHTPIRQEAVLLQHGASNTAAKAFLAFLRGESARQIIHRYGYTTDGD